MPRLFWKLFFALWLSIMAFAVVVAWINQTVITQHAVEEPAKTFEASLLRLEVKLARDLKEGGVAVFQKADADQLLPDDDLRPVEVARQIEMTPHDGADNTPITTEMICVISLASN